MYGCENSNMDRSMSTLISIVLEYIRYRQYTAASALPSEFKHFSQIFLFSLLVDFELFSLQPFFEDDILKVVIKFKGISFTRAGQ